MSDDIRAGDVHERLCEGLSIAGTHFNGYAVLFQNEGTDEGRRRAAVARQLANECFTRLADAREAFSNALGDGERL